MGYVMTAWKIIQIGIAVYNALKEAGVDLKKPIKEIHEAVATSMATAHTVQEAIEKAKSEAR